MPLFIVFVFGAVVLGAGVMLSPAWPTKQPRIGLAASLALALVVGGAIFWAMLFGWDTLVIDYLLFALITTIFLGGTLAQAQTRAEAKGEILTDAQQGWPGPKDLAFFALVALLFIIPVLILPVPLDTDAQGFGYLALMTRMGGTFDTLAPFQPDIHYLYSPAFSALTAYLSQQLDQPMHLVQFSLAAALAFLCVWLAYDFGSELQDKRLGRAMAVAMLGGLGLFLAFIDSHFTAVMGLVFALAFLTYAMRYLRHRYPMDAIAAGLLLGAVVLTHPDTTIILGLGYVPWLLTMWLGDKSGDYPTWRSWLVMLLGIPAVALIGIAPWLVQMQDLLGQEIVSPFARDPNHWRVMLFYHGVLIVPVAIIGAIIGLRKRNQAALLAVGWLLLILDFSTTGILESLFPGLVAPILRYDYPFSIAWHGPIIPYTVLGGFGLLWLWDNFIAKQTHIMAFISRRSYWLLGGAAATLLLILVFNQQILSFSKGKVGFFGAFASYADVQAMTWLRENTSADARILNFPAPQEGDWVPVIAERESVYYRWQPFFQVNESLFHDELLAMRSWSASNDENFVQRDKEHLQASGINFVTAEQIRLYSFWRNPADPVHLEALKTFGIDYVIVPQVIGNPDSFQQMFRWRPPFAWELEMQSQVADASYLQLVFEADGAQVFKVADEAN
jgi:hypothetical protein